eukprot:jgi/Chlat1/7720/Chrsp66S07318
MLETDVATAYKRIREQARQATASTVLVFVSTADCDSICALKILTTLFKQDSVPYSVLPVCGYEALTKHAAKTTNDDGQAIIVVMINCGGAEPVRNILQCGPSTTVYIIDSHRPLNHSNINSNNKQVVVLCTDDDRQKLAELLGPLLREPDVDEGDDDDAESNQQLHERVHHEGYQSCYEELKQLVYTRNIDVEKKRTLEDGTVVLNPQKARINSAEELRFYQIRHWSLHDSMLHSPYVATQLKTWTGAGRRELDRMLARMGIPLNECHQKYTHMGPDLKKQEVSAPDVVYAATSVLEIGFGSSAQDPLSSFWAAADLLSVDCNRQLFQAAVARSCMMQRAMLKVIGHLLQLQAVQPHRNLVTIELPENDDAYLLAHPLALAKLTRAVRSAAKDMLGAGRKRRPFITVAHRRDQRFSLVVGVAERPRLESPGNMLSIAFNTAIEELRGEYKADGFEATVVEIDRKEVARFKEILLDKYMAGNS